MFENSFSHFFEEETFLKSRQKYSWTCFSISVEHNSSLKVLRF